MAEETDSQTPADSPTGLPASDGSLCDSPAWKACGEAMRKSDEERIERMKNHPDNGKHGWWIVEGIRHHAYAKATTAVEAIEKAHKTGIVQDWEFPESRFWTEELPDVF